MGLLFGSAGAHTYLKSGKLPPPPSKMIRHKLLSTVKSHLKKTPFFQNSPFHFLNKDIFKKKNQTLNAYI